MRPVLGDGFHGHGDDPPARGILGELARLQDHFHVVPFFQAQDGLLQGRQKPTVAHQAFHAKGPCGKRKRPVVHRFQGIAQSHRTMGLYLHGCILPGILITPLRPPKILH